MRTLIAALGLVLLATPTARAVDLVAVENFVDGLPNEDAECGFMLGLCRAAALSTARADTVPANADLIYTHQGLTALDRIDEAAAAADALARKHGGHMPECVASPECSAVVPRPAAPRKKSTR